MNSYLSTIIKKNDKICYEVEIEDESAPKLKLKKSLTTAQPARRPIFDVIAQLRSEKEAAANIKSEETTTINRNSYQIDKYNKLAKKYHTKDLVTHEIFEGLLVSEVSDEEDWERFMSGLQHKLKQR